MKKILKYLIRIGLVNLLMLYAVLTVINLQKSDTTKKSLAPAPQGSKSAFTPTGTKSSSADTTISQGKSQTQPSPTPENLFSQLSKHNTQADCWIAYGGHIYDITSYFGSHPGGDAKLLGYCGKDATVGFDTKDKSPGQPHSQAALSQLQQLMIQ